MVCDVINALQGFIMFCVVFFDRENVRRIRTKFGELRLIGDLESNYFFTITLANNVISRWAAWIIVFFVYGHSRGSNPRQAVKLYRPGTLEGGSTD